jgi:hypothetical protein
MYALCSPAMVNEALANSTAIRGRFVGDILVKPAAARRISMDALISVDESKPDQLKELVVNRLQSDRNEKFEFLDGRSFSGEEAAKEVCKRTAIGQYFFELEKETLRIVQEAFRRGEF